MLAILVQFSFFCLGLCCLIGAVLAFSLASRGDRNERLEEYEKAVREWPPRRAALERASGSVALHAAVALPEGPRNSTTALSLATEPDHFQGTDEGPELKEYAYTSSFYRAGSAWLVRRYWRSFATSRPTSSAVTKPKPAPESADSGAGFLPEVGVGRLQAVTELMQWGVNASFLLSIGSSEIQLDAAALVRAVGHFEPAGVYDRCRDFGGFEGPGEMCWVYERLHHICVQVEQHHGAWRLRRRGRGAGAYGCTYDGGRWAALTYAKLPVAPGPDGKWHEPMLPTASFGDFSVEVRAAADPLFTALAVTQGSMAFGWSSAEQEILGFVLLVLGSVFVVQPCLTVLWKLRKGRDRLKRALPPSGRTDARRSLGRAASPARWRRGGMDAEIVGIRHAEQDEGELDKL